MMKDQTAFNARLGELARKLEPDLADAVRASSVASTMLDQTLDKPERNGNYRTFMLGKDEVEDLTWVVFQAQQRIEHVSARFYECFDAARVEPKD